MSPGICWPKRRSQVEEAELDYLFDEIPVAVKQSLDGVAKVSSIVTAMKDFARPGHQ